MNKTNIETDTASGNAPKDWKYEVGQKVNRFGQRATIVSRSISAFGKPTYEIASYYMGNLVTTSVWQDELKA